MTQSAESAALAVLLTHESEPCGEYRPDYRAEWWRCPACGWESGRQPYRDPGGVAIHQARALAEAGLLETRHTPPGLPIHRTEAGYPNCSTCDGGGCPDCTDPA